MPDRTPCGAPLRLFSFCFSSIRRTLASFLLSYECAIFPMNRSCVPNPCYMLLFFSCLASEDFSQPLIRPLAVTAPPIEAFCEWPPLSRVQLRLTSRKQFEYTFAGPAPSPP